MPLGTSFREKKAENSTLQIIIIENLETMGSWSKKPTQTGYVLGTQFSKL